MDVETSPAVDTTKPLIVIEPRHGWQPIDIRELWAYRELFWVLMERDIKVRYKQTVLGSSWAVLQPVLTMIVFSIFFGHLAKVPSDGLPYPIFVYAGLLPWIFFSNTVSSAGNSLVSSSHLVSKVYFPRLLIPLACVGAGLLDLAIATVVLLLMMLYYGIGIGFGLLLLPALTLGVALAALAAGTLLSALNVAYRDFRYVIPFLLQTGMLVTPVAYPASLVPEGWRTLYHVNPMAGLIEAFRSVLLDRPVDLKGLMISLAAVAVLFIVSLAYFRSVERKFADII